MENLSIVWEEITRAKEPINYYKVGDNPNKLFDLIKPFPFKNKSGKNYDFFYVKIVSEIFSWNYFPIIATSQTFKKEGRLRYCYGIPVVNVTTILGILDGSTRLYGANEANPTSIVFYGGYISK